MMRKNRFLAILLIIALASLFVDCQVLKRSVVPSVVDKVDNMPKTRYVRLIKRGWKDFYKLYFYESAYPSETDNPRPSIIKDDSDLLGIDSLKLPMVQEGQYYLIFIKGLKFQDVIKSMRVDFPVIPEGDLDLENLELSDIRETERDYAIIMKNQEKIDETLDEAAQASEKETSGMTLLEYLILELRYYNEYQRHLPPSICCGSHDNAGQVPEVSWSQEKKALVIRMVNFNPCSRQPVRIVYGQY